MAEVVAQGLIAVRRQVWPNPQRAFVGAYPYRVAKVRAQE
jgi:hypothetical protein